MERPPRVWSSVEHDDVLAPPDLLTGLRRHWVVALAVVVLCAGLGGAAAGLLSPTATATASLVVSDPRAETLYGGGVSDRNYVANQVAVLQLRSTAARAVDLLPTESARVLLPEEELHEELAVETPGESGLITVSFTTRSPELAQAAVNAVLTAYQEMLRSNNERTRTESLRSIDAAIAELDRQIAARGEEEQSASLVDSRDQLVQRRVEVSVGMSTNTGILVVDQATLPTPSLPLSRTTAAILGGLLGLPPAAGLAYILSLNQRRFQTRYEPEAALGERLLSDVPNFSSERLRSDVPALDAVDSASAEAFRFATTLLGVRQGDLDSVTHAVVSGSSQDGKTTVCANLAVTAALAGRRVLAIDGDLDGRGLSFLLLGGEHGGAGLIEALRGTSTLPAAVVQVDLPGGRSLDVLRGGAADAGVGELLAGGRTRDLLTALQADYDLVLVDVPPLLQVAYAAGLVRAADAAVVVVPHDSTETRLTDLAERLEFLQVPVLGYVYNKAPLRSELGQHSRLVTDTRRRPARGESPATDEAPAAASTGPAATVATTTDGAPTAGAGSLAHERPRA